MEEIPYVDLRRRFEQHSNDIQSAVNRVLQQGSYIGGKEVEAFEGNWARFCGAKFCIGVANGLDAIRLTLIGYGIGEGDEVLVPAQTFVATWLAVIQVGATPIPIDIDPATHNMSLEMARSAITSRTSAIIVVHLHGRVSDMKGFRTLAESRSLLLIEDAAQAHGALYDGHRAGNLGDAASFSFYPTKNLGAIGDAGCITTNDRQLADKVRSIRSYGSKVDNKYQYDNLGWNSRLDPIQAVVLDLFISHLDEWNSRRRTIAMRYLEALGSPSLTSLKQSISEDTTNVWHHFILYPENRSAWQAHLSDCGIRTDIHYPLAPVEMEIFSSKMNLISEAFPNAIRHSQRVLSIPLHPWLVDDEVQRIEDALASGPHL
jgi:dTDP-4-amino-4,6-dideoxygalactose transaminase